MSQGILVKESRVMESRVTYKELLGSCLTYQVTTVVTQTHTPSTSNKLAKRGDEPSGERGG